MKLRFIAPLFLAPVLWPGIVRAATPTTTILSSSPNPSAFGQPVTITAQLSSTAATGKLTFFNGVTIVGIAALSGGVATLTTTMLPSGVSSLTAYYSGDSTYSASTSPPVRQTVRAVGAKAFHISASYPVGQGPRGLAIADFNGDGKADIAVVNEMDNTVSVMLGKGDGSFSAAGTYTVSADAWFIATGDFNGDGKVDLIVVATRDVNPQVATVGQLNVLLGNGDGTFQPPLNTDSRYLPTQVAVADFNSDGIADLAATVNGSNEIDIHLGNGDGTFQPFTSYSFLRAVSSVIADFNGDGKPDLAVSGPANINIFLGKGDATLQLLPEQYSSGPSNYPGFLAAGDFNGDGKVDLVDAGWSTSGTVQVYLGKGDGTFGAGTPYTPGQGPDSVAVADLNGDGILDLVTSNFWGNNLSIFYGRGDGTFQPATSFGAPSDFFAPLFVAVADFNGDGIPDFAVSNSGYNEVTIVLGVASLAPDLTISKSHAGTFAQGQKGAGYNLTVSNVGFQPTSGLVSVVDNLPASLTATAVSGTGWSCTLSALKCTRSDALAVNAIYPPITVTVNVAADAPISVTNTATVAGGGETNTGNDSASDVTAIGQANAPVLSTGGIVNASFARGALPASPGSLIAIFGANLSGASQGATVDGDGRLPLSLAGTSVQMGSRAAPLLYVSPGQVNVQVPFELTPGNYTVVVTTAAGPSNTLNLAVTAASPGVFAGAVVNNATGALINAGNPLLPGDAIVIYCTGLGAVSPNVPTGKLGPGNPISFSTAAPSVTIGGVPLQVANAVLSPGYVGLYQIGFVVPGGLPQGGQPLIITSGNVTAPAVQVFSAPSLDPQYCADVSGTWNVTQMATVREIVTSAVENDDSSNSATAKGTITIVQTGCSIRYTPIPVPGLITQSQAATLARTGRVIGNTISLQGLLTTPELAVSAIPGLTITAVSENTFQASGPLTGAVLITSDSGKFTGTGAYSKNGQTGSFTLTYILTGSATLVRPGVTFTGPPATYNYQGNHFTFFFGAPGVSSANSIAASLTFASPLPKNFSGDPGGTDANKLTPKDQILPTSWSIYDGVHTISSANGGVLNLFELATDSSGSINSWHIIACTDLACSGPDLTTAFNDPGTPGYVFDLYGNQYTGTSGDLAYVRSNPGKWVQASAP